jgi:hypothetical protein
MGFKPYQTFTGLVNFQFAISQMITEWGEKWNATLNSIMSAFKFKVLNFFYGLRLIND